MPAGGFMSPVVGLGSGKFGTPWARMQRDTARSFCISCALTGGGGVLGRVYLAQASAAARYSGEDIAPLPLKALMALAAPGEVGSSGKFKMPCERMHVAYSRGSPLADGPPVAGAPAPAVVVVVVPTLATPGELPPQAAAARARPITAAATSGSRRRPGPPPTSTAASSRQCRLLGSPRSRACCWSMG